MLFLYLYIFAQIFLESFPISSSGHSALLQQWYSFLYPSFQNPLLSSLCTGTTIHQDVFDALLHGPTLLILFFFFFHRWFFLLRHPVRCRFIIAKLILYIFISTSIALFFYFVVQIQHYRLPLGIGFFITACAALSTRWTKTGTGSLTLSSSFIIGMAQAVALLPGISRLGTTYAVSRWLGISSRRSFEISFLMQAPLIAAACGKSILTLSSAHLLGKLLNLPLLLIIMISTVAAWYGLRASFYSANHGYWWYFALYMLAPLISWLIIVSL